MLPRVMASGSITKCCGGQGGRKGRARLVSKKVIIPLWATSTNIMIGLWERRYEGGNYKYVSHKFIKKQTSSAFFI